MCRAAWHSSLTSSQQEPVMDALAALLSRSSANRLVEPAPMGEQRERIFRAALRAPDHSHLRPWRFLIVEGEGRARLGEVLAAAMQRHAPDTEAQVLNRLRVNPLRAPLLIVLVAHVRAHPNVPEIEQLLSLACAADNMLLAAHAEGFGAIWRTGAVIYTPELRAGLGLVENERVLGVLYLGTSEGPPKPLEELPLEVYFRPWP